MGGLVNLREVTGCAGFATFWMVIPSLQLWSSAAMNSVVPFTADPTIIDSAI